MLASELLALPRNVFSDFPISMLGHKSGTKRISMVLAQCIKIRCKAEGAKTIAFVRAEGPFSLSGRKNIDAKRGMS